MEESRKKDPIAVKQGGGERKCYPPRDIFMKGLFLLHSLFNHVYSILSTRDGLFLPYQITDSENHYETISLSLSLSFSRVYFHFNTSRIEFHISRAFQAR